MSKRTTLAFCMVHLLLCGSGSLSHAATLTVCMASCDHTSIQAAVSASNDGDTIEMNVLGFHTESSIAVDKSIRIVGQGPDQTTVQAAQAQGSNSGRVFNIQGGAQVEMFGFSIRHGHTPFGRGGAILVLSDSSLSMEKMTIYANDASEGGAIATDGALSLDGVSVLLNSALLGGGGLSNTGGTVYLRKTFVFSNTSTIGGGIYSVGTTGLDTSNVFANVAEEEGGGIFVQQGALNAIRSSVSENDGSYGGGIFIQGGQLTIIHSSIYENHAFLDGGGLYQIGNAGGRLSNVTIVGNTADRNSGGVHVESGTLNLANSTVSLNTATVSPGGMHVEDSATVKVTSAIIALNKASGGDYPDCDGALRGSYSLVGNTGPVPRCAVGGFTAGMLYNLSPGLSFPEGDRYLRILPLVASSPAIDTGNCDDADGNGLTRDQRYYFMPVDGNSDAFVGCDMGAYEYNSTPAPTEEVIFATGFE